MGTPDQRFSPLANTLKRSELKGIRRECADAVGDVVRSARFQAFKSMARAIGPYDPAIEAPCHDIAHMILDALPATSAYRGVVGLITHAAHTRDSRELVRIAEALAEKGALA